MCVWHVCEMVYGVCGSIYVRGIVAHEASTF